MRPLTLHVSALSDAEYTFYTSSLNDLALSNDDNLHDDEYYENLSVGVREARAWLRGRFSDLPVSDVDMILKLFHPNLGQADSLSGGQFFAALRLVVHVQGGKAFDRTLAFVQANPVNSAQTPPSPPKPQHQQPLPPVHRAHTQPPTLSPPSSSSVATTAPNTSTNPFSHSQPPPPSAPPPYQQASATTNPNNPFLARSKTINGPLNSPITKPGTDLVERSTSPPKIPPLPPRKAPPPVPFVPPPRHASLLLSQPPPSLANVTMKTTVSAPGPSSSKPTPPPPPTKINHVTSTLMRQSLQASKAAQSMKKAEEELERERVLSVLKSSSASSVNTAGRNRSASPNKQPDGSSDGSYGKTGPPLPSRRRPNQMPSPPPSTTASTGSLGEVAGASVGRGRCRSASRERTSPFHTFGRSSPFAAGGPFGNPHGTNNNPNSILGNNSPFRASPSSMINSPSGSPSRNLADLPPVPHSPLPGPPPMHPARKNSASNSHPYPYSHPHVQPHPPPPPDSFDSIYAAGIDGPGLGGIDGGGGEGDGAGPNQNQNRATSPSTIPDTNTSPTTRVVRSKSVHYPSPVPMLPPRRRRPESVQLTPTSPTGPSPFRGRRSPSPSPSPFDTPLPESPRYGSGLSRHASLSMPPRAHGRQPPFEAGPSRSAHGAGASSSAAPAMTNIQRTLLKLDSLHPQKLQPKLDALQPKLDKARYKAEAGLSRKGYVNHSTYGRGMWEEGEQGLIGNREDQDHGVDRYRYGGDVSDEEDEAGGMLRERSRSGVSDLDASDDLKWPVGEGWKPL